ncbi:MAG TPA: Uma2 family endonuclease [Gemmataceae bacterium]
MAAGTAPPDVETFADVIHRLGDIPPERVLAKPYPATEVDVLRLMEAPRKRLCELIDGVLVEKAVGYNESDLAGAILHYLRAWVLPRNLGIVTGADGIVRLWSGRLRIPDVAFTSWDRLPGRRRPAEPIPDLVPDLAVEVLSQSNTPAEMEQKRQDYFRAGVRLVWEIDPDRRTVAVYTAADQGTTLTAADTLDGGDVLPGFALPLRDLFAELDRHG